MHAHSRRNQFPLAVSLPLLTVLLMLSSCRSKNHELKLTDLTVGERLYCERVIALERAKTVALIHREAGETLLDSLATAWGDSVTPEAIAGLSGDPQRSVAVSGLLLRILAAEQDSLRGDPGGNRLHLPIPDPDRPGHQRPALPDTSPGSAIPRI